MKERTNHSQTISLISRKSFFLTLFIWFRNVFRTTLLSTFSISLLKKRSEHIFNLIRAAATTFFDLSSSKTGSHGTQDVLQAEGMNFFDFLNGRDLRFLQTFDFQIPTSFDLLLALHGNPVASNKHINKNRHKTKNHPETLGKGLPRGGQASSYVTVSSTREAQSPRKAQLWICSDLCCLARILGRSWR